MLLKNLPLSGKTDRKMRTHCINIKANNLLNLLNTNFLEGSTLQETSEAVRKNFRTISETKDCGFC